MKHNSISSLQLKEKSCSVTLIILKMAMDFISYGLNTCKSTNPGKIS